MKHVTGPEALAKELELVRRYVSARDTEGRLGLCLARNGNHLRGNGESSTMPDRQSQRFPFMKKRV
jgi:hypothetical protein